MPAIYNKPAVPLGLVCHPVPADSLPHPNTFHSFAANDLVALELSAAIENTGGRGAQFYPLAIGFLGLRDTPTVTGEFRSLSELPDPEIRTLGAIGLVRVGDARILSMRLEIDRPLLDIQLVEAVRNVRIPAAGTVEALYKSV